MGTTVVIGNFDGVHLGHRAVLQAARAHNGNGYVMAVTFWPHPNWVIRPGTGPLLLSTLEDRLALLAEAGADATQVVDFTPELAQWTPAEFVDRVIRPLRPDHVVVGDNFRFGRGAAGNVDTLREIADGEFEVNGLDLVLEGAGPTSSTRIRQVLAEGDVTAAAHMLGRWYRFGGEVQRGDQRGRELGVPTANLLAVHGYAVPQDGVYAGWMTCREQPKLGTLPVAISVGSNPTFDGMERRVESHVLDRDDLDLYGDHIDVEFVAHVRGQVRFDGVESLVEQMQQDIADVRVLLG
ncbi:bifunctional riboflavin kinase/FAD synthetase [Enemella sp. A6]|uniref:bifunctional riboflavin kinase/FAD synthetase n=1 Tax=Enemella sp. A6 TaxID=3440152 RepID=UPI003EB6F4F8